MGKVVESITPELQKFIAEQPLFFVGTAPLAADGHVNVSPKGLDCFRVLGPLEVAYLDLTGSGNETAAHLLENGRITFMFCAFTGRPKIVRLYGQGRPILPGADRWEELLARYPEYPGIRQIIIATIHRVQTSCGFAVPSMQLVGQRDALLNWAEKKGDALPEYQRTRNGRSIDGLPTPHLLDGSSEGPRDQTALEFAPSFREPGV